jgi:hypothetical protein
MEIDFEWRRDDEGFALTKPHGRPVKSPHFDTPIPAQRLVPRSGRWVSYKPFDGNKKLYQKFAGIRTPAAALAFVSAYGPLTESGRARAGEELPFVLTQAGNMEFVLLHASDPALLSSFLSVNILKLANIEARLEAKQDRPGVQIKLCPQSFLDGLWLQLGHDLAGEDRVLRRCRHCGIPFEAGLGSGRRIDALFCSDKHRIAFNSKKRKKEK